MEVVVTASTEEQGFSLEGYHPHHPGWFWPSCMLMDVFHGSYVMYLYLFPASTQFAYFREKPLYEF